uniref:Uncharacterized protein n=1 Tax=Opuntia streptacantha TaxID=393608 RepID=A0A7C9AMT3_OPUST
MRRCSSADLCTVWPTVHHALGFSCHPSQYPLVFPTCHQKYHECLLGLLARSPSFLATVSGFADQGSELCVDAPTTVMGDHSRRSFGWPIAKYPVTCVRQYLVQDSLP